MKMKGHNLTLKNSALAAHYTISDKKKSARAYDTPDTKSISHRVYLRNSVTTILNINLEHIS